MMRKWRSRAVSIGPRRPRSRGENRKVGLLRLGTWGGRGAWAAHGLGIASGAASGFPPHLHDQDESRLSTPCPTSSHALSTFGVFALRSAGQPVLNRPPSGPRQHRKTHPNPCAPALYAAVGPDLAPPPHDYGGFSVPLRRSAHARAKQRREEIERALGGRILPRDDAWRNDGGPHRERSRWGPPASEKGGLRAQHHSGAMMVISGGHPPLQ
ncbi:MAG: hypothetical protein JWM27_1463 [Gemmatimonadetes bacterium]|nr:hypothetical protein [Gemmatimonadota bacterium]